MSEPWLDGVRGEQVLPLILSDRKVIRVEAGPGTGKTFGLARRVQRLLHPDGAAARGADVLVVAFNRVIAKSLKGDISARLAESPHDGEPIVLTVHALCMRILGSTPRLILEDEFECLVYDVMEGDPARAELRPFATAERTIRFEEAGIAKNPVVRNAVTHWLERHGADLIDRVPNRLLDRISQGDFVAERFEHVMVDEFQDLTRAEQRLFARMVRPGGSFVGLGDPRQSIYAFRGNDRDGLDSLEELFSESPLDVPMNQCLRCPEVVVQAANALMAGRRPGDMDSGNELSATVVPVVWESVDAEVRGMAKRIADNFAVRRTDDHLVMVTRREFGYLLRDELLELDPEFPVELSFSESVLETWPAREAFYFFTLLFAPDGPSWRAWLGFGTDREPKAPRRNAPAYLALLTAVDDVISESCILDVASGDRVVTGSGATNLRRRAQRYAALRTAFEPREDADATAVIETFFAAAKWTTSETPDLVRAAADLAIIRQRATEAAAEELDTELSTQLGNVARTLRHQIATRETFGSDSTERVRVATLWGAKGATADHAYVIGLCAEAVPGRKHPTSALTAAEYLEEQRRLFYVTITRAKQTLVLSRATTARNAQARDLNLVGRRWGEHHRLLTMSPFLSDIIDFLPDAVAGNEWEGLA